MAYPEHLIAPMREELARYGVLETRTAEDVKRVLESHSTVLMVVNSVCGCAAGKARPAVGMALQHHVRPEAAATVFAGADLEATQYVRDLLAPLPPSSPSMALFRGGKPVFMLHRFQIESRQAPEIARDLAAAFEEHCAAQPA
jgi:putative YphP/YqiW family bacilliredoxin